MLVRLLSAVVLGAFCFGLVGCGGSGVKLDTASTIRYEPGKDSTPKEMGGPAGKSGKGKGSSGQTAPPP